MLQSRDCRMFGDLSRVIGFIPTMFVSLFKFTGQIVLYNHLLMVMQHLVVPLKPLNPHPVLRVILAKKGTHFGGFSQNICPFFLIFWVFTENGPMFSGIFVENGTYVWGFLVKKQPTRVSSIKYQLYFHKTLHQNTSRLKKRHIYNKIIWRSRLESQ